jgi:uncharacterized membrane protein YdjX (TVP38/TMEM64 family)
MQDGSSRCSSVLNLCSWCPIQVSFISVNKNALAIVGLKNKVFKTNASCYRKTPTVTYGDIECLAVTSSRLRNILFSRQQWPGRSLHPTIDGFNVCNSLTFHKDFTQLIEQAHCYLYSINFTEEVKSMRIRQKCLLAVSAFWLASSEGAFTSRRRTLTRSINNEHIRYNTPRHMFGNNNRDQEALEEEARIKILESRRYAIRSILKAAEATRNFRVANNYVPEIDPSTGKPVKSDAKSAVTLTAFVVATGAIALRVGGRAALVAAIGLDFANDNPELKQQLDQILQVSATMDPIEKLALFTASWTAVKLLCFDAGGVALALSSGILFGGVFQGAVVSAAAATFGSSVAFGMAKLDTPVRNKALELVDKYPSLRGIEKVVARDGLKAILTLRLAPILPIPLGLYNYVYGVTNVPFLDFAGGIFFGSLKPYLLDSYLGYFGKEVIEGSSDASGMQDILLLAALGASVLIGVFASQLASETWDSVLEEVKADERVLQAELGADDKPEDDVTREFLGVKLPEFLIAFQQALKAADERISDMVVEEYNAQVWNYTKSDGGPPPDRNPAMLPTSIEKMEAYKGFDFGAANCDAIVLSPILLSAFVRFADPLFDATECEFLQNRPRRTTSSDVNGQSTRSSVANVQRVVTPRELLERLEALETRTKARIDQLDQRIDNDSIVSYGANSK